MTLLRSSATFLALLGEADLLAGQIICPRTPPNALASFAGVVPKPEDWIVEGVCAYVPQVSSTINSSGFSVLFIYIIRRPGSEMRLFEVGVESPVLKWIA